MSEPIESSQAALAEKIKAVRFAMFTTTDEHGHLVSRPMTNQEMDGDGNLWFYTSTDTDLWQNIAARPQVNVSFAEPNDHLYVSVSGTAEREVDRATIKKLWNPMVQAWFPNGPDDPNVVLVRVVSHSAEYWDSQVGRVVQLFQIVKAVLTGTTPDVGTHAHVNL